MKRFRKTLAGKVICYILCIFCIISATVSVLGGIEIYDSGMYVYNKDRVQSDFYQRNVDADMYDIMYHVGNDVENIAYVNKDMTNLRFTIFDKDGKKVFSNTNKKFGLNDKNWEYTDYFKVKKNKYGDIEVLQLGDSGIKSYKNYYTTKCFIAENTGVFDKYFFGAKLIEWGYELRYAIVGIGIASVIGFLVAFFNLIAVAGRRNDSDQLHCTVFDRIPSDVLLAAYVTAAGLAICCSIDLVCYQDDLFAVVMVAGSVILSVMLGVLLCIEGAIRVKAGTLVKNAVIYKLLRLIVKTTLRGAKLTLQVIKTIPMIIKTVVGLGVFIGLEVLEAVLLTEWNEAGLVVWCVKNLLVVLVVICSAMWLRELKKSGEALAEGDLSHWTDTSKMILDFKEHGENLNNIASGMAKAVEDRLKSERMKTELITNVSHDIKNPLTSIISYAELINDEKCENEKHGEYAEILVKKSEHLKRLLEDIVEISKATTGNLDISMAPCQGDVLLSQLCGEFEERCQEAGLELVVRGQDKKAVFLGDSRRIWRVFENLMSNVCKYSLAGSRVYLDMDVIEKDVYFTFKNTSKEALNISPDELMERFVRGDESRNTEGNGLGLSIADSLMTLQQGNMTILIDGDLFKVTLKFKGL